MKAQRPSPCGACGNLILIGDVIIRDPLDGAGKSWIHGHCPPDPKPADVCNRCLMEISLSGECGC